jgi:hypothetical protein
MNNNVGEGNKERRKVKFPCKIYTDDHLIHLYPKLVEAGRLLSLPHAVLMNHFPHNQHMASSSSNDENVAGGIQNPPTQNGDQFFIIMVNY